MLGVSNFAGLGFVLDQCSCIGAFVVGLFIFGHYIYGSTTFRMSTRRLPVMLFVSRSSIHLYPVVCCAECLWWPEEAFTLYTYLDMSVIYGLLIVFCSSSSSYCLRGLSANLTARGYVKGYSVNCCCPVLATFITMSVSCPSGLCLLPPFRWLPVRLG